MFNHDFKSEAVREYEIAAAFFNTLIDESQTTAANFNKTIKGGVSSLYAVEYLIGSITGIPIKLAQEVKQITPTRGRYYARDFNAEARKETLFTGGVLAVSGTTTIVGTQVANRFLVKAAPKIIGTAALKAGGSVALRGLIGPIGWALLGTEVVWAACSIRKKNAKIAHDALNAAQKLRENSHDLSTDIAKTNALSKKIKSLSEGVADLLERCGRLRATNYEDLPGNDQQQLWTLVNAAMALVSAIQPENTKKRWHNGNC
ncbi:hypothetical protein SRRS_49190 [Sporomusa rhizae]|uniref:hypothetical protein n=1 Tax=Sporomusa rhizae TaxID=357999 RepID=UPI00352A761F